MNERWLLSGFLLTLFGVLVLPAVPLWSGLWRLLGVAMVLLYGRTALPRWVRHATWISALAVFALVLFFNAALLLETPLLYARSTLSVEGIPYPLIVEIIRAVGDGALLLLLGWLAWGDSQTRVQRIIVAALGGFAAWHYLGIWIDAATYFESKDSLSSLRLFSQAVSRMEGHSDPLRQLKHYSALFDIMGGVMASLLAWLLCKRHTEFVPMLQSYVVAAGMVIASILLLQHAVGDYSYVIEHPDIAQYMLRAKASYYYHAPAAWVVGLALLFALGSPRALRWENIAILVVLFLAAYLNGTRAVNVGIVCGALVLVIWHLQARQRYKALAAIIVLVFSATQIFYEKPDIQMASSKAIEPSSVGTIDKAENSATSAEADKINKNMEQFVASNGARSMLLNHAIRKLSEAPWFGDGPGTIRIPLDGRELGGELETSSSHSAPLDIALSAGIPALLLLALAAGGVAASMLWFLLGCRRKASWDNTTVAAMAAGIAFWLSTSPFFPQERSFVVGMFFVLLVAGLWCTQRSQESMREIPLPRAARALQVLMAMGAVVFSAGTSASVTMPLVELLVVQPAASSDRPSQAYYTNSPKILAAARLLHALGDSRLSRLSLLNKSNAGLPDTQGWILWDPAEGRHYTKLIQQLGYIYQRGYGLFPAFVLPRAWQTVDRMQSSVSILHSGPFPREVPVYDVGNVRLNGQYMSMDYQHPYLMLVPGMNQIVIELNRIAAHDVLDVARQKYMPLLDMEWKANGKQVPSVVDRHLVHVLLDKKPMHTLSAQIDNPTSRDISIELRFIETLYEDFARSAYISWHGDHVTRLTDNRLTNAWESKMNEAQLVVDNQDMRYRLHMYQLVIAHEAKLRLPESFSWRVEASNNAMDWVAVDTRTNIVFPDYPGNSRNFYLDSGVPYRWYRLTFQGVPTDTVAFTEWLMFSRQPATKGEK